jgi:hypothetical protein
VYGCCNRIAIRFDTKQATFSSESWAFVLVCSRLIVGNDPSL